MSHHSMVIMLKWLLSASKAAITHFKPSMCGPHKRLHFCCLLGPHPQSQSWIIVEINSFLSPWAIHMVVLARQVLWLACVQSRIDSGTSRWSRLMRCSCSTTILMQNMAQSNCADATRASFQSGWLWPSCAHGAYPRIQLRRALNMILHLAWAEFNWALTILSPGGMMGGQLGQRPEGPSPHQSLGHYIGLAWTRVLYLP